MDVADLVGVHEARVAHHVAAVGQVDREHRAAAVLDGRGAVIVKRVGGDPEVASGIQLLDAAEERRHPSPSDRRRSRGGGRSSPCRRGCPARRSAPGSRPAARRRGRASWRRRRGSLAHLDDAVGAERVGFARKPELREGPVLLLEERRRRPPRLEGSNGDRPVHELRCAPYRRRDRGDALAPHSC